MIRTQITLTEAQMAGLRDLARRRGVSMAAVVRGSVDATLAAEDRDRDWDRALAVAGAFRSGLPDLGRHHDAYLDEAYDDRHTPGADEPAARAR